MSKSDILNNSINIKQYHEDKSIKDLVLKDRIIDLDARMKLSCPIDYLRVSCAIFKPETPQTSGSIHVITRHNKSP